MAEVIDQSAGLFLANEDNVLKMRPRTLGEAERERIGNVELFINTLPWELERQAGEPIYSPSLRDLDLFGRTAWLWLHAPHHWLGMPKRADAGAEEYVKTADLWKRGQLLPMIWRRIPVNGAEKFSTRDKDGGGVDFQPTAWPVYGDGGVVEVLWVQRMSARDILERFRDEDGSLSATGTQFQDRLTGETIGLERDVELVSWYSRDYVVYFVDFGSKKKQGERYFHVEQFPHMMGELPVAWIEGESSDAFSIGAKLLQNTQQLDRSVSQLATAVRTFGWPIMVQELDPESEEMTGKRDLLEIVNHQIAIKGDGKEKISFLSPPRDPGAATLVTFLLSMLDRQAPTSAILQTTAPEASGFAFNSRQMIAQVKLRVQKSALERAWEKSGRLMLKMVELIDEPVPLYVLDTGGDRSKWLELSAKDVGGYYHLEGSIEAVMPQDLPRQATVAIQLQQAGLADDTWIRENLLDITASEDMERKLRLQALRKSPLYQAVLIRDAFREEEDELAAQELAEAQKTLQVDQDAMPEALRLILAEATGGGGNGAGGLQGGRPAGGAPTPQNLQPAAQTGV